MGSRNCGISNHGGLNVGVVRILQSFSSCTADTGITTTPSATQQLLQRQLSAGSSTPRGEKLYAKAASADARISGATRTSGMASIGVFHLINFPFLVSLPGKKDARVH